MYKNVYNYKKRQKGAVFMKKQDIEHLDLWDALRKAKTEYKKKEIRKKIADIYYPLVRKIASKMEKRLSHISADELASYGVDGLLSAIDRFCPEMGVTFPCYANFRIQGSMVDNIRKDDVIPRSVRMNYNKIETIRDSMIAEKGTNVTMDEVLSEAKIELTDFNINVKKYIPTSFVSIDGSDIRSSDRQEDFKQDVNDALLDKKTNSPDDEIIRREFLHKLISNGFSREEQKIIYYYYYENLTMEDIAAKLRMSESRVSQLHSEILPKMKNKILRNPKYFKAEINKFISCIPVREEPDSIFE